MKPVIWHPDAENDLAEIVDYIALDNAIAAVKLARRIVGTVEKNLPPNPNMGRSGRVTGTREFVVHKNYVVVYEIVADAVNVIKIIHAAKLYPRN